MKSIEKPAADRHHDSLLISVRVEPDGTKFAQNVELVSNDTRLRFYFGADRSLDTVFSPTMHDEVQGLVERAMRRRGVLMLPDLRVYLRHLVLARCRVLTAPSGRGGEQVLICFSEYFGNAFSLFHESIVKLGAMNTNTTDVAVEMLESAYLPIMNLGEHVRSLLDRSETTDPKELRAEMREVYDRILAMKFYQSMLVRYVNAEMLEERSRALNADRNDAGDSLARLTQAV